MLGVGKKKKGKLHRSRKTASRLCLRFCEIATKWQKNEESRGFPILFYSGSISKVGSITGWEGKKKADLTS